jgi:hypothetical protein
LIEIKPKAFVLVAYINVPMLQAKMWVLPVRSKIEVVAPKADIRAARHRHDTILHHSSIGHRVGLIWQRDVLYPHIVQLIPDDVP